MRWLKRHLSRTAILGALLAPPGLRLELRVQLGEASAGHRVLPQLEVAAAQGLDAGQGQGEHLFMAALHDLGRGPRKGKATGNCGKSLREEHGQDRLAPGERGKALRRICPGKFTPSTDEKG